MKIPGQLSAEINKRGFATAALAKRYNGKLPAILDERQDINADLIQTVARNGISFMPPFRKTELSDQDLADISAYLMTDLKNRPRGRQIASLPRSD